MYYYFGCPPAAAAIAIGGLLATAVPALLRWTGSCALVGNYMALDLLCVLTVVASCTGGYRGPGAMWLAVVPMVATITGGRASGLAWTVLASAEVVTFYVLERGGATFQTAMDRGEWDLLAVAGLAALLLVVFSLTWLYDSTRAWALNLAASREQALADALRQNELTASDLAATNQVLQCEIQERRQAEQTLEASEAKYRYLVDAAQNVIWSLDTSGHITFVNPVVRQVYGCAPEEMIGRSFTEFEPPERAKRTWERFRRLMVDKSCFHIEAEHLRMDGTPVFVSLTAVPVVDEQGRVTGITGTTVDITERKHTEEELRRAKDSAEAATCAKSEFLANMSHEIRTPMTAILGFAENLLAPQLAEAERVDAIQTIRRNGQYLLGIINDILDLSKIEAGRMTIERIACSPRQLVEDVATLARVRSDEKGLRLACDYAGGIPETIRTDPTRLRQILVNVIANAIKFTRAGGVRVVTQLVRTVDGAPHLQFDVEDSGIGMTPGQVECLFTPFTQADASTTRRFGGTGLGLTISKRFAGMLGGDVSVVRSSPGVGTCFRITVATGSLDGIRMLAADMPNDPVEPAQPEKAAATRLEARILLAEDGPDNQRLISYILKKAGASVAVVEDGQQAVEAALAAYGEGRAFDVILMDMQMPVLDGYEATRLLRSEGYAGTIIALTAHAMTADRQKCLDAGCDEYATKPVDRQALVATVRRMLDRRLEPAEGEHRR